MSDKRKCPHKAGTSETLLGGVGVPEADYQSTGVKAQVPRSWQPLFNRVASARNLAQLMPALGELVPRLLSRGQPPEAVAHDLAQLATRQGTRPRHADVVLPVVADHALRRASA